MTGRRVLSRSDTAPIVIARLDVQSGDITFEDSGWMRESSPRMTARPCGPHSLTRLGILDFELSKRTGYDKVIVVEHQRPRHTVLEQLE